MNLWDNLALAVGGAVLVLFPAAILAFPSRSLVQWRLRRFTRETGAYLDPSFLSEFEARFRRQFREAAGYIVALAAGWFVALAALHLDPLLVLGPLVALAVVVRATGRLRAAGREFSVPNRRSTVARPRRVALSDYVALRTQVLNGVAISITLFLAVRVLVERDELGGTLTTVVLVAVVAVLGTAAFTVWFGRAICDRPTPAVDASHLYLQDAWRADALTETYLQLRMSVFVLVLGVTGGTDLALGFPTASGLLAATMVMQLVSLPIPHQHFRRRLWSTLRPGQVLLPGQAVPPPIGANA